MGRREVLSSCCPDERVVLALCILLGVGSQHRLMLCDVWLPLVLAKWRGLLVGGFSSSFCLFFFFIPFLKFYIYRFIGSSLSLLLFFFFLADEASVAFEG